MRRVSSNLACGFILLVLLPFLITCAAKSLVVRPQQQQQQRVSAGEGGGGGDGLRSMLRKLVRMGRVKKEESAEELSQFPAHLNPVFDGYNFLERAECPPSPSGRTSFFCPTPNPEGGYRCVRVEQFCDGTPDCPGGEDEDTQKCFFYRPVVSQLEDLSGALARVFQLLSRVVPSSHVEGAAGATVATVADNFDSRVRIEPAAAPPMPSPLPSLQETPSMGFLPPAPSNRRFEGQDEGGGGGGSGVGEVDFDLIRQIQADEDQRELQRISEERTSFARALEELEELLREEVEEGEGGETRRRSRQQRKLELRKTLGDFQEFRKLRN